MRRPWQIWSVFAGCLLLIVVAVGWLSYRALESERAEQAARGRAALEENARLALWRLDSAVAPLVAQENANPDAIFRPLADSRQGKATTGKTPFVPSPLLGTSNPQIRLHFEIDASGEIRSPEVLSPAQVARLAVPTVSDEQLQQNRERLEQLERLVDRPRLLAGLSRAAPPLIVQVPDAQAWPAAPLVAAFSTVSSDPIVEGALPFDLAQSQLTQQIEPQQQAEQPQARGNNEFQARQQAVAFNSTYSQSTASALTPTDVKPAVMTPLWVDDQLLLVRQVDALGERLIQGCWLDWPAVRQQLLASVRDLLPQARLEPADPADQGELSHRMAALPVTLVTGSLPMLSPERLSPVRLSLVIAWGSLLAAALAAAILLAGVLALSERRAAFVSAVTHELRTPLTTFRMYAEMLAEGMVPDEQDRRNYLETLSIEAGRLSHLVENVLAYARLERGGPTGRIVPVPVGELLERASERLAGRAAASGFAVVSSTPDEVLAMQALADPAAVEQILFNLVDNACKYAEAAQDRTLRLEAASAAGKVLIRLRDQGPGVGRPQRKRLFQPFRKSASDAAQSAPGVGLGLALCRRLARDMGGELALEDENRGGACFLLTLKAVAAPGV